MMVRLSSVFCLLLLLAVNDQANAASAKPRGSKSSVILPRITVEDAEAYVKTANEELRVQKNIIGLASWAQSSNITAENDQAYIEASQRYDEFSKAQFNKVKAYFDIFDQLQPYTRRQLEKMGIIGTSALTTADASTFSRSSLEMKKVYSTATITAGGKPGLELEPQLTEILATSSNEALLREVWLNWRDATGPNMRQDYITYYTLGNKAAKLNSLPGKAFQTYDDLWMAEWETADMKAQVDKLMEETMPLYKKIHAYVRYHLKKRYGEAVMPKDGTIPAHLLGNMWAQQWGNLLTVISEMSPHPDVEAIDAKVNEKLKNWTVEQMFRLSEKFFADLGMQNMTATFWEKSILKKPTDRNLTCHASAWDFYDASNADFRIKQCTDMTMSDLVTVHHEMGHVQYYMNYVVQPAIYRRGANPGFHEAIGDLIALAVATPEHLVKVNLLDPIPPANVEKIKLNYQMKMALDKVAFLPFAYVMDKWRWDVFGDKDGAIETQMNRRWWEYRLQYQGLSPPGRKRNEKDFDPGAKYHIPAGVEYVRYFASHVLQFQFYEKMCKSVDGITDDNLYTCDFDGNREAGTALMDMLKKGSSQTWPEILESFIGSKTMSLSSLNKYFKPLEVFLDKFIENNKITVGWNPKIEDYVEPMNAADFLDAANEQYRRALNAMTDAEWQLGSNITETNEANLVEAVEDFNAFRQKQFNQTKQFNFDSSMAPFERRQFEKFAVIGTSALDETDATTFTNAKLAMETTFSTATIDAGGKEGLTLEPDLTEILATSTDEPLLKEVWTKFRDATGKKMRTDYETYFTLGNKAAKLNTLPGKVFNTFDDLWMFPWEADDLKSQVDTLMNETLPLYKKIHAYVRHHLKTRYGDKVMPKDGTIPAHLLGNMWAQSWSNLLNIIPSLNPKSEVSPIDAEVDKKLSTWTIEQLYRLSEKFFHDLGMKNMTPTFWQKSILVKPTDRNMTCHASAWDFFAPTKDDYRIKQCTLLNINQLRTVHHEMGHIQYFMEYSRQPPIYREGANPGFHEAIGDLIALAVSTPEHLVKVNLLDPIPAENLTAINLNYQMKMALDKVAFLPFSYVMDKWRWDVFGGKTPTSSMNHRWWELSIGYQGISPPVRRSENDFDPGAKYHIPAGVEYVRYFASHVLQFQFLEQMCKSVQGITDDNLYTCDFDGNTAAGTQLITMLRKGSSDKWQNILKDFIGSEKMSLSSLNKYFKPLEAFLDNFIAENKITVGWTANVDDYIGEGPLGNGLTASSNSFFLFTSIFAAVFYFVFTS